jgi:hypothetical protein
MGSRLQRRLGLGAVRIVAFVVGGIEGVGRVRQWRMGEDWIVTCAVIAWWRLCWGTAVDS